MQEEDEDSIVEFAIDRPTLVDFEGNDALSQSPDDIKHQIQRYSTAALPALLQKALTIALSSKNEKNVLEAIKLIKTFSEGQFAEKAIEGQAKRLSDSEIIEKLKVIG